MRFLTMLLALCITATGAFAQTITVADIIKMTEGGISEEVILLRIGQETNPPNIDQILEMKKAGVSDKVVAAMFNSGSANSTPAPDIPEKELSEKSDTGGGVPYVGAAAGSVKSGVGRIGGGVASLFGRKKRQDTDTGQSVEGRRVYITAQPKVVNGAEFQNEEMKESVRDLEAAARNKGFAVTKESDADFKILLLERGMEEIPSKFWRHRTRRIENTLKAALFERKGDTWKPVTTLTDSSNNWRHAADRMMKEVKILVQ